MAGIHGGNTEIKVELRVAQLVGELSAPVVSLGRLALRHQGFDFVGGRGPRPLQRRGEQDKQRKTAEVKHYKYPFP